MVKSQRKKIQKVILTYPNQLWYKKDLTTTWNLNPYTICLLATMIKGEVDVKIVDAQFYNMSEEAFKRQVEKYKPDLVGISQMTSEYATIAHKAAEIVKHVNKDIIVLMGGVHVTTMYLDVMKDTNIDYAITGEGEYVFKDFIKYLNNEGPFPTKGMVYRKDNSEVKALPKELIQDMDALPFVDYSFVDFKDYGNKTQRYSLDAPTEFPFIRMPSSRGCPVGCTFCQVENISGAPYRSYSPVRLVEEMEHLQKYYGIKYFNFDDDNAFYDKKRTKEIMRLLIDRKLDLKFKASGVSVFCLDNEVVDLLAMANCEMINIAIESGVERVLKDIVEKPVKLQKVTEMIKYCKSKGIFMVANFIIGFPGESWDEIRQTLKFAETCGADYVKIYIAIPIHGTKLYEMAKKMNVILGDEHEISWRYGRMSTKSFSPIDVSILRVYEWDRINFTDENKRKKTAKIMNITELELDKIRIETRQALDLETLSKDTKEEEQKRKKNLMERETVGYPATGDKAPDRSLEKTENLLNMARMMN